MSTNQTLFTEIASEESVAINGGRRYSGGHGGGGSNGGGTDLHFNLDDYLFVVGAGVIFGNQGLTAFELDTAWTTALGLGM